MLPSSPNALLLWLDRSPGHFWALVALTSGLVLASALLAMFGPPRGARWNRPVVFGALLALALFAFRWPGIFDNQQSWNPDESQMIAGAIVLRTAPVFWESVDGTTHGPLVQWPLAALGAAGLPLDFTGARLFSVALMWVVVVCTWLTLGLVLGDGVGRVLVLPLAFLINSAQFFDFVQYSSEHVPVALIAVATWLVVAETLARGGRRNWRLGLAGVLLGALPFAKLQSAPIGLWLGLAGTVLVLIEAGIPWWRRVRRAGWLVAGALTVPAGMLAMILGHGIWRDFWDAYIGGNLMYAQTYRTDWWLVAQAFAAHAALAPNFPPYVFPMLALLGVGLLLGRERWRQPGEARGRFALFALGGLFAALYAILSPNRPFTHYLQFAFAPVALATGAVFGGAWAGAGGWFGRWRRALGVAVFLVAGLWFQVAYVVAQPVEHLGRYTATRGERVQCRVASLLIRLTARADGFALWGWEPRLYVETGRRHATREAHSALQIYDSGLRRFYRERYLADLKRAAPPYFVDAVGAGNFAFQDRPTRAHESFAELGEYVRANYELVADVEGTRIYARRDRAPAAKRWFAEFR